MMTDTHYSLSLSLSDFIRKLEETWSSNVLSLVLSFDQEWMKKQVNGESFHLQVADLNQNGRSSCFIQTIKIKIFE